MLCQGYKILVQYIKSYTCEVKGDCDMGCKDNFNAIRGTRIIVTTARVYVTRQRIPSVIRIILSVDQLGAADRARQRKDIENN